MFESTGWIIEEPGVTLDNSKLLPMSIIRPPKNHACSENMNPKIKIIKQYQFSSHLQRMSVIAYVENCNEFRAYTKGSPEMILALSKPETIPHEILDILQEYTEQGYRVLAIGCSENYMGATEVSL